MLSTDTEHSEPKLDANMFKTVKKIVEESSIKTTFHTCKSELSGELSDCKLSLLQHFIDKLDTISTAFPILVIDWPHCDISSVHNRLSLCFKVRQMLIPISLAEKNKEAKFKFQVIGQKYSEKLNVCVEKFGNFTKDYEFNDEMKGITSLLRSDRLKESVQANYFIFGHPGSGKSHLVNMLLDNEQLFYQKFKSKLAYLVGAEKMHKECLSQNKLTLVFDQPIQELIFKSFGRCNKVSVNYTITKSLRALLRDSLPAERPFLIVVGQTGTNISHGRLVYLTIDDLTISDITIHSQEKENNLMSFLSSLRQHTRVFIKCLSLTSSTPLISDAEEHIKIKMLYAALIKSLEVQQNEENELSVTTSILQSNVNITKEIHEYLFTIDTWSRNFPLFDVPNLSLVFGENLKNLSEKYPNVLAAFNNRTSIGYFMSLFESLLAANYDEHLVLILNTGEPFKNRTLFDELKSKIALKIKCFTAKISTVSNHCRISEKNILLDWNTVNEDLLGHSTKYDKHINDVTYDHQMSNCRKIQNKAECSILKHLCTTNGSSQVTNCTDSKCLSKDTCEDYFTMLPDKSICLLKLFMSSIVTETIKKCPTLIFVHYNADYISFHKQHLQLVKLPWECKVQLKNLRRISLLNEALKINFKSDFEEIFIKANMVFDSIGLMMTMGHHYSSFGKNSRLCIKNTPYLKSQNNSKSKYNREDQDMTSRSSTCVVCTFPYDGKSISF